MLGGAIFYHLYEFASMDQRDLSSFDLCYKARTQGSNYDGAAALHDCQQLSLSKAGPHFSKLFG
jgi:hypothetical protein